MRDRIASGLRSIGTNCLNPTMDLVWHHRRMRQFGFSFGLGRAVRFIRETIVIEISIPISDRLIESDECSFYLDGVHWSIDS